MKRLDADTVEFDKNFENEAVGDFEEHLSAGLSVGDAVALVKEKYGTDLSKEFYDYLYES
jgi:uncharacterized protein YoaH (UPF0181 family)